jgi:thioredoxin reductase (NADPH)
MEEKGDSVYKVIIIGSGPAGLTAALYAARSQLKPLVFEGMTPGGQLLTATEVENYPGFPEGVQGPELMESFRKQAERFGTEIISTIVEKVDFLHRPFTIWSIEQRKYQSHAVIIAMGSSYKWLGLESEEKLKGHGVSACATCDGFFFKDKEVIVIGGGDTAMEEALFLTRLASKVTIIHRRDQFRASKIMSDRVLGHPKINIIWNSIVEEIVGDPDTTGVTGVLIKNVLNGNRDNVLCSGVFIAIGHKPNTSLFEGILDIDKNGYLVTKPGSTHTSVEGVFACGEVQDNTYRQVIVSAGSGSMAAIDAEHWLEACDLC